MRVEEFMTHKLIVVRAEDGARRTFFRMRELGIRHMPVVDDDGQLVGVVSDRDLRRPDWVEESVDISHFYKLDDNVTAGDLMSGAPVTVRAGDSMQTATKLFLHHRFGCLPVVGEGDALVGIISPLDVLRAFAESDESDSDGDAG